MSVWILLGLFVIGLLAILLEGFLPAGGLIGIAGGLCLIAGIVWAFVSVSVTAGAIALGSLAVLSPLALYLGFRIFPRSSLGKGLVLQHSQRKEGGYTSYSDELYTDLVGAEGICLTALRPSGMAKILDRKWSAVTSGEYVEKGARIRVVKVEGSRIVVRKTLEKGDRV